MLNYRRRVVRVRVYIYWVPTGIHITLEYFVIKIQRDIDEVHPFNIRSNFNLKIQAFKSIIFLMSTSFIFEKFSNNIRPSSLYKTILSISIPSQARKFRGFGRILEPHENAKVTSGVVFNHRSSLYNRTDLQSTGRYSSEIEFMVLKYDVGFLAAKKCSSCR